MNLRGLALVTPLLALVVYGCVVGELSGDANREAANNTPTGEPCGDDPFKCKAGTTCWPALDGGAACVPSKPYKTKGTDCELLLGRSSCADGLVCITVSKPLDAGADTGVKDAAPKPTSEPLSLCAPWCDDKHPCPAGEDCRTLSLEGYSGRACVPSNFETPDTGVPDTAVPDTYRPDTFKPDTFVPDGAMDTTVADAISDTEPPADTEPPPDTEPPADTEPPPDTTPPADAADAD